MSFNEVYITRTAKFLPNQPISSDEMEDYLGMISGKPSKSRRIVLRNNGIKTRYYALTKEGKATHTNAQMAALAIRGLFENEPSGLKSIQYLSCATSSADQIIPSHAVMVHGWLPETNAIEVVSPSGVCCSGMHALKQAFMSVKSGESKFAVSTASERISRMLRADQYEEEVQKLTELEENPYISFEKDFLRWMLSDGAGAFLLSSRKNETSISLRIDWIEAVSYAHKLEPCMYMGAEKSEDGSLKGYMDFSPTEINQKSILSLKQDTKLLAEHIISLGFDQLKNIFDRRGLTVEDIDYLLPHMSSNFFGIKIAEKLEENGMSIPQSKWFTNLSYTGNVGSASIYLMIDELFRSGKLKREQKLLVVVPESARFSYVYALLTVV
jgi:3-oxoacyl-[acyl-carrier-protein] synthase III